jgi:hypothetical protein
VGGVMWNWRAFALGFAAILLIWLVALEATGRI